MKSHWLSCKVYKMMEQSGASEGSEWGMQRALDIKWHIDDNTGKKHLCSFTDREHKIISDYEKRKKSGKESYHIYKTADDFFAELDGKPTKKIFKGKDEYGNKEYEVSRK